MRNNLVINKMMLLGDIHIDDYKAYNFTPGYRRNQYLKFAEHINQICLEKEIDCIALLGDTLNRAVNSPEMVHLLKEFLEIISMRSNRRVIHICGQHDYNCKVNKASYEATLMNLYPEYTTYVGGGTIINSNGYSIALRDWVPGETADTSFINGKVNFMLGHVTLLENFGQSIDQTKFDVGVFGDIHQQVQLGNCHSIGTPFYHFRIDEEQNGRYGLLDFTIPGLKSEDILSWHVIDPSGVKYLKLVHTSIPIEEGEEFDEATNTVYKYIPQIIEDNDQHKFTEEQLETISKLTDNDSIITYINDSFSKNGELSSIHKEVLAEINWESELVDLDFKLLNIDISNYRSIDKLSYDFVKCTAIIGDVGSGKSSFLDSIKAALNAEKIPENKIRRGQDYCEINLKLEYQGNVYTLSASSAQWHYAKNGEWSTKSVRDRKAEALELMPFLNYTDLFIFTSEDSSLLSAMNDDRKSEILAKLYNIDVLDKLCNRGQELLREQTKLTRNVDEELIRVESSIKTNESRLRSDLVDKSTDQLKIELQLMKDRDSKLRQEFDTFNKLSIDLPKYSRIIDPYISHQEELRVVKATISEIKPVVEENNKYMDSWTAKIKAKSDYNNLLAKSKEQYNDLMQLYSEIKSYKEQLDADIETIRKGVCNYCGSKLRENVLEEQIANRRKTYDLTNTRLTQRYEKDIKAYEETTKKLKELDDIDISDLKTTYEEATRNLTSYNTALVRYYQIEKYLLENANKYDDAVYMKTDGEITLKSLEFKSAQEYNQELIKISSLSNTYTSELVTREDIQKSREFESELLMKKKVSVEREGVLSNYISATSNTSELYQSILKLIAHKFSNDQYKLTVESYIYRNKPRISISMKYLNGAYYFDYEDCSTAQKCFCDIYFLSKLLKGTGVLIMDEYFKNVPSEPMVGVVGILNEVNANNLLFSSHHDNLVVSGEVLKFELVDNVTKIEIL